MCASTAPRDSVAGGMDGVSNGVGTHTGSHLGSQDLEHLTAALWQRCTAHFHHNVFSYVPRNQTRGAAARVRAIHAHENREAAQEKVSKGINEPWRMRLGKAAELVYLKLDPARAY